MSGTVKTVLVVSAVAVGAVVLLKALVPSAAVGARTSQPSNSTAASLIGLIPDAVAAGKKIFGGSSAPAGSTSDAHYTEGESFDDYSSKLFGPGINPDGTGA